MLFMGFFAASPVEAATCTFNRTLSEGSEGEDVRCLQKFLNSEGYTISTTGAGSVGKETDEFKSLTKKAVERWQKSNGLTDDGYFGSGSRAKYTKAVSTIATSSNSSSVEVARLKADLQIAENTITMLKSTNSASFSPSIRTATIDLNKLNRELNKAEDDGVRVSKAEYEYVVALKSFVQAIKYDIDNNSSEALRYLNKVKESIIDVEKIIDDETENEGDLEETLEDLDDELDDLEDEIEDRNDDGEDVNDAEDLLDDARDLLDDAEDEYEDAEYEDTRDELNDLYEIIEDLYNALSLNRGGTEDSAEDAIDDAEDAIDDAEEEIEKAKDEGEDVTDAEDLLDDAESLLDDAEDEFDDENYEKAQELAEEAQELAEDAEDEL